MNGLRVTKFMPRVSAYLSDFTPFLAGFPLMGGGHPMGFF